MDQYRNFGYRLYEWIVQSHLKRRFGEVYYYRNNYEIDAIAGNLKI